MTKPEESREGLRLASSPPPRSFSFRFYCSAASFLERASGSGIRTG